MTRSLNGEDRQRRRSEIIRAAVDVFAQRGYFAARMREVATKAGVADGTLYLYFKGKEDLLVSVLEEYAGEFMQRARRDVLATKDPVAQLRAVVERHLVSFENNRALAHVFQIELRHTRRFLRQIAKGKVAEYLLLLQHVIANGIAQGVFRDDIPPEMAARAVFGALDELVTSWVLATRPKRLAPQAAALVRLLLNGLQTQGKRG